MIKYRIYEIGEFWSRYLIETATYKLSNKLFFETIENIICGIKNQFMRDKWGVEVKGDYVKIFEEKRKEFDKKYDILFDLSNLKNGF